MFKRLFSFLYWKQEIIERGNDNFKDMNILRRVYNHKTGEYEYPRWSKAYVIYKRTNTITESVKLVKKYLD